MPSADAGVRGARRLGPYCCRRARASGSDRPSRVDRAIASAASIDSACHATVRRDSAAFAATAGPAASLPVLRHLDPEPPSDLPVSEANRSIERIAIGEDAEHTRAQFVSRPVAPRAHRPLGNRPEHADAIAEIDDEALDALRLPPGVGLDERRRPRTWRIGRIAEPIARPSGGNAGFLADALAQDTSHRDGRSQSPSPGRRATAHRSTRAVPHRASRRRSGRPAARRRAVRLGPRQSAMKEAVSLSGGCSRQGQSSREYDEPSKDLAVTVRNISGHGENSRAIRTPERAN